ncbi:MAG: hypothetical protein WCL18_08650 [bacterium]
MVTLFVWSLGNINFLGGNVANTLAVFSSIVVNQCIYNVPLNVVSAFAVFSSIVFNQIRSKFFALNVAKSLAVDSSSSVTHSNHKKFPLNVASSSATLGVIVFLVNQSKVNVSHVKEANTLAVG